MKTKTEKIKEELELEQRINLSERAPRVLKKSPKDLAEVCKDGGEMERRATGGFVCIEEV